MGFTSRQNSNLVFSFCTSVFLSLRLPSVTSLHNVQGCLPSKVLVIASTRVVLWEYLTTIPAQATDCSTTQCSPMDNTSAATTKSLDNRANTGARLMPFITCVNG